MCNPVVNLRDYRRTDAPCFTAVPAQCVSQLCQLLNRHRIYYHCWPWPELVAMDEPPMDPKEAMAALEACDAKGVYGMAPTVFETFFDQETMADIVLAIRLSDKWIEEAASQYPSGNPEFFQRLRNIDDPERNKMVLNARQQVLDKYLASRR